MVLRYEESLNAVLDAENASLFADFLEKIAYMGTFVVLTGDIEQASEDVFATVNEAVIDEDGSRITLAAETDPSSDEARPELKVAGSSVIGEECDGANEALLLSGVPDPERVAERLGMYDPDHKHGGDPHWPESAAMEGGTRFVQYEDGSVEVFDKNGHRIAAMDGDGNVIQPYGGPMMNSTPCPVCPLEENEAAGYPEVREPVEVAPSEVPPRIAPILTVVECPESGECITAYRNFLVFSSEEQARAFFADTEQARAFFATFENNGSCVYISDGVGSVQTIEFEMRNGEPVMRRGMPVLNDNLKTTTFNNGRYHMSDKIFEERYLRGLGGPAEVRREELQDIRTRDVWVPGGAQELRIDPETGRWEFESATESEKRIIYAAIDTTGMTVEQYAKVMDMPLPAIFDTPINPDASPKDIERAIEARANALKELINARLGSEAITDRGAENLARYLSLGGYQTGGTTIRDAVSHVAQHQVDGLRDYATR